MNNETPQKIERAFSAFVKFLVIFIASFVFLGFIFWAVFYWDYTANLMFVIPARNWYQSTYWQVEGLFVAKSSSYPPFNPIYTIQSVGTLDGKSNYYIFLGNFFSIDTQSETIQLKGVDGKIYNFNASSNISPLQNQTGLGFDMPMLSIDKYLTTDARASEGTIIDASRIKFSDTDKIEVKWSDSRALYQIFNDYNKSKNTPLNLNLQTYFILINNSSKNYY